MKFEKLFFITLCSFSLFFIFLLNHGYNSKLEMEKNKKELILKLEDRFGEIKIKKDFSKSNGYAFLYFSRSFKSNYKIELASVGLTEMEEGFCYKGAFLEYQDDDLLSFKYVYPDKRCIKNRADGKSWR